MRYALNLAEDGRVLSVTKEIFAPINAVLVDEKPEGNVAAYRYIDGQYLYDPLPVEVIEEKPTQLDRIEAQVAYLAMMTGNEDILEV